MRRLRLARPVRRAAALLLGAGLLLAHRPAAAVSVTTGSTSGLAGQTVEIAISTGDLTGLNVTSIQFNLVFSASVVTPTAVSETGTSIGAAGWGHATFNVVGGVVSVSDAGTTPLSGSGPLIKLQFAINPALLGGSSTSLTPQSFVFNEGVPTATTSGGTISVNPTPIITVSPNTGEIVRGQTLQFTVSGSVTNPVAWSTTDPLIATISASGLLTGVAPGAVRVHVLDNAGRSDDSNGDILIRGMGLTAGAATIAQGQSVTVPITVTSLDQLGIRSGQFTLGFNANLLTATGVTTPPGTLLYHYGPVGFGAGSGSCTVDFAGSADLAGSGTLCYVSFASSAQTSGSTTLTLSNAVFNETLPAKTTNGSVGVTALPTITVSPDGVTLLAGQTQQFTLSGGPTPPITWSTLDAGVATISAGGLLTAQAGGVTKVRAMDALGATDENTSVTVYDFKVTVGTVVAPPGVTIRVPLLLDRDVSGLDIRSVQYSLLWNPAQITGSQARHAGLIGSWGQDQVVSNPLSGRINVAAGGATALPAGGNELHELLLTVAPGVAIGTNIPLTLSGFLCNEGRPSAQVVNGVIQVRSVVAVPMDGDPRGFGISRIEPNPARAAARIHFTIPEAEGAGGRVTLAIYAVDGRRVRTVLDRVVEPGERDAMWDGRDEAGAPAPAGVYLCRLGWRGRELARKLALVR